MFSTYTMAVMFICAVSSAASFGAYLLTRNRTYMFAASGFFLYFFDLASIFQMENLSHGAPITLEQLYGIQFPYYKALLAAGMLESCWLSICEYLDEKSVTLKIGPGVAFLIGDLLIAAALPEGPIKQWLFYSAREAFLAWCLLFLLFVSLSNRKSSVEKALVLRQKRFIAMVAMMASLASDAGFHVAPLYLGAQFLRESPGHNPWCNSGAPCRGCAEAPARRTSYASGGQSRTLCSPIDVAVQR